MELLASAEDKYSSVARIGYAERTIQIYQSAFERQEATDTITARVTTTAAAVASIGH